MYMQVNMTINHRMAYSSIQAGSTCSMNIHAYIAAVQVFNQDIRQIFSVMMQ